MLISFSLQSMENGLHYMAVAFAMQLVKLLLVDERSVSHVTEADLFDSLDCRVVLCTNMGITMIQSAHCTRVVPQN